MQHVKPLVDVSWNGYELREGGSTDGRFTVLALPGGISTAAFYDEQLLDPRFGERDVRLVAATPPGFGSLPLPAGLTFEDYATSASELARHVNADVVVGHSFGANIALEMAAQRSFDGPVVLLSPSFSMNDEEAVFRKIAALSPVPLLGRIPFWLVGRLMGAMFGKSVSPEMLAQMRRSDMMDQRQTVIEYVRYQRQYADETLVGRLRASGVPAIAAFGDHDEIGLTDAERAAIEASPNIELVEVEHSGHMLMHDNPDRTTEIILSALP